MIPRDFIDDLLAKTDIVDIIDRHVPLKKSGANYMACCPFHKEKSPSFSVSPQKQFYHCFGCGAHGSAIGFVMEHQGMGFTEAVHYLADRVGMTVPHVSGSPPEQRSERKKQQQQLESALDRAAAFYRSQLERSPEAQHYLQQRGLSADIIERYGIGYAPAGWQPLAQAFSPYPAPALLENGLTVDKDGKQYDRFRQRIMFPIREAGGKIIGFGGRVLNDDKPKYLNSPDTPLFHKGKNLYGLYEARHAVREAGRILVTEGYMDVVALACHGIGYGVATLGTAATADHIKILMRQSKHIYFCFDGDEAGRKAAWRALENALPQLKDDATLSFLLLPEQHDPDSYIRQYGKQRFEEILLHQSRPLSAFFWDSLIPSGSLNNQEEKAELVKTAAPLLKQITAAPTLAHLLYQELSRKTGIDPADLSRLTGQSAPRQRSTAKRYTLPEQSFRQPATPNLSHKQIRALLSHPQWSAYVIFPDYLPVQDEFACLNALAQFYRQHPAAHMAQAVEHFRDSPYLPILEAVLSHNGLPESSTDNSDEERQSFQDGMHRLTAELKNRHINLLKQKNSEQGLSPNEKQLLIQLLSSR